MKNLTITPSDKMEDITVKWMGPYSFDQLTPKELMRKMGIYAVMHGPSYLFIGQTKHGKAIFREAKINREEEYWKGLKKLGIVNGDQPAWYKLKDDVYKNCQLYAGVVSKNELNLVDDLHKLLVFKFQPVCNEQHVKHLDAINLLTVYHIGSLPEGLENQIVSLE
jgi:hypothetical protein